MINTPNTAALITLIKQYTEENLNLKPNNKSNIKKPVGPTPRRKLFNFTLEK